MNKCRIIAIGITLFLLGNNKVFANDIYLTQSATGAADGTSCSNAFPVTYFNTAGNWGTGSNQIGPGTTVHLCGTFTASAGAAEYLKFQGNGTAGNPITLKFETNAILQAPWFSSAVATNSNSYLVIDGGTNGIIQNTSNGTGLTYAQSGIGIWARTSAGSGHDVEIKNITVRNMYVRSSNTDYPNMPARARAIVFAGSNVSIHNSVFHDSEWTLVHDYTGSDTNISIYNNDIYNTDHGIVLAGANTSNVSNIYIYNNKIHDYANWDSPTNQWHHDGIHAYGFCSGGVCTKVNEVYIYNNYFYNPGTNITGHIFLEGGAQDGSGTPWTTNNTRSYLFNNVLMDADMQVYYGTENLIFNNTIIGHSPSVAGANLISLQFGVNPTVKNNYMSGWGNLINYSGQILNSSGAIANVDYNAYSNCIGYNCWNRPGLPNATNSWSTYRATGADAHGVQDVSFTNQTTGGVNQTTGIPSSTAIVNSVGTNLTAYCTGRMASLCNDTTLGNTRTPSSRPSIGAWDIGAYNHSTVSPSSAKPLAPSSIIVR